MISCLHCQCALLKYLSGERRVCLVGWNSPGPVETPLFHSCLPFLHSSLLCVWIFSFSPLPSHRYLFYLILSSFSLPTLTFLSLFFPFSLSFCCLSIISPLSIPPSLPPFLSRLCVYLKCSPFHPFLPLPLSVKSDRQWNVLC